MEEKNIILGEGERLDRVNGDISLIQNTNGLLFGTDALMLSSFIKPLPSGTAAELGPGSGIISLLLLVGEKFSHIDTFEVQPYYASLTERNAALNGLSGRLVSFEADVRSIPGELCGKYDAVFSNPPYMGVSSGKANGDERKYIARHEVKGGIPDFVSAAARLVRYGGRAYFVMRPDRLADITVSMRENSLEPKRLKFVKATPHSMPSSVLIEGVRGGRSGLTVEADIILN